MGNFRVSVYGMKLSVAVIVVGLLSVCQAFYLPGVAPHEYQKGENISIKINSIKSTKTAIPYDYYSLMVCRPPETKGKVKADAENMGELLWGELIKPSRYQAKMLADVSCSKLCTTRPKGAIGSKDQLRGLKKLKTRIDDEYRGHFILDNLPVSEVYLWEGTKKGGGFHYKRGYPLGTPGNKTRSTVVNNHLSFTVKYHRPEGLPGFRIVGFEVIPYSVANKHIDEQCRPGNDEWAPDTYPAQPVVVQPLEQATAALSWSYSIKWVEDTDVEWSSRWDHYLQSTDASNKHIHWFAIVNSLLIVLFLSGMVAMILLRALHKDFNRYNNPDNEDEAQEETGWKMIHADVFRQPANSGLLSIYIGTGSQLFGMASVTLVFALAGFLSPARRGWLMKMMMISYCLMGVVGGLITAIIAKMFHAQSWKTVAGTGMMFPGQLFGVFFLLNLMLWGKGAATAVPFFTLVGILSLWLFVSVPLVFLGAVLGYKLNVWVDTPQSVSPLPRPIPAMKWYMQPMVIVLFAGAVPFGAAFVELYFILSSLWLNKFYYVFGFFAIVFLILIITCTEMAVVLVYFQLCYENHQWWWPSFMYAGSSGLWLFLYSVYYFWTALNIQKFWSVVLYFSYMGLLSYFVAVMTGTVGFFGSLVFVRYIYDNLKVA